MTCEYRYVDVNIADLQRIAANVEAERRRLHRAELADELRKRLTSRRKTRATLMYLDEVDQWLDELSPPVHCDNPPQRLVSDEVAFFEATKSE